MFSLIRNRFIQINYGCCKKCQSKQHAKQRKLVFKVIILVDKQYYTTSLFYRPTAPITSQCELAKKVIWRVFASYTPLNVQSAHFLLPEHLVLLQSIS